MPVIPVVMATSATILALSLIPSIDGLTITTLFLSSKPSLVYLMPVLV